MSEISVMLENQEKIYQSDTLSITMDSTPQDILNAVQAVVLEESGVNIKNEDGTFIYNVRKSTEKDTIFVIPKTILG